jgi:ABC-2 type transport system permease protein
MLRRIGAVMYKEWFHMARDRIALLMLIVFPVFVLFLFGFAINLDISHIKLGFLDRDQTQVSRSLNDKFIQSGYFDLVQRLYSIDQINPSVDKRIVKVALHIPLDFSRDIYRGRKTPVQIIIDAADNNTATIIMGYSSAIMATFSRNMLEELIASQAMNFPAQLPGVDLRPAIWYNPELKSSIFLIPGLIGMILMSITVIRISITIVKEKEMGTMEALLVSPLKPIELMAGKITPYIIIAFVSLVLILILSRLIFEVPFRGNLLTFFALSALFIAASLGIGLYISNIAQTAQTAWLMGFLSSILPAIILSGFIFPIESMPLPIRFFTFIFPIRYYLVILRGIILKGAGLSILYPEAIILFVFALALITASALKFKKKVG